MKMTREELSAAAKKGHTVTSVVQKMMDDEQIVFPILEIVDEMGEKYRLTEAMKRFLMWRLKFATDSKCAKAVGVSPDTVMRWKRNDMAHGYKDPPDFKSAYAELMRRNRELAEKSMAMLGIRTVEVANELLNATKKTIIPREGKSAEIIETPDYENRYRGAQVVSNWMGEWGAKAPVQSSPVYVAILDGFNELIEAKKRALLTDGKAVEGSIIDVTADRVSQ